VAQNWSGNDPALRKLRIFAAIAVGALLAYAVFDSRDGETIAMLIGALLVILGFEAGLRWPSGGVKGGSKE